MAQLIHVVCPGCNGVNRLPAERLAQRPSCGRCKRPLFPGRPIALRGESFDVHAGRGDLPVVVDFWAPWCGPCRTMAPHFERAAAALEPGVRLAKVDTEAEPGLAGRFGIRSIPTLVAFRGGQEIARRSGAMDEASLLAWVRSVTR